MVDYCWCVYWKKCMLWHPFLICQVIGDCPLTEVTIIFFAFLYLFVVVIVLWSSIL